MKDKKKSSTNAWAKILALVLAVLMALGVIAPLVLR